MTRILTILLLLTLSASAQVFFAKKPSTLLYTTKAQLSAKMENTDSTYFMSYALSTNAAYPKGILTNSWMNGVYGLRTLAVRNGTGDPTGCGTLISPQFFVTAGHTAPPANRLFVWCDTNGVLITNHVTATEKIGPWVTYTGYTGYEFSVCLLSNTMPASCEFMRVFDSACLTNQTAYLLGVGRNYGSYYQIMPRSLFGVTRNLGVSISHLNPGWRTEWWIYSSNGFVDGDSGYPVFIMNNNELYLVGVHSTSYGCTTDVPTDIQDAMNTLCDTYGRTRETLKTATYTNGKFVLSQ